MDGRKKRAIESCMVKRAANDGFIVRQEYDNRDAGPSYQPGEDLAFGTLDEVHGYLDKVFGKGKSKDAGEKDSKGSDDRRGPSGSSGRTASSGFKDLDQVNARPVPAPSGRPVGGE